MPKGHPGKEKKTAPVQAGYSEMFGYVSKESDTEKKPTMLGDPVLRNLDLVIMLRATEGD